MNKKVKKYLIPLAIVVVIVLAVVLWPKGNKAAMVLTTTTVEKGDLTTSVTATGTVEPIVLVEIGTQVSGVISKIYVDYNSDVKSGQVLAELDKQLLNSELETANANLQTRQAELELQQLTYNRNKALWEKQAISKSDWETVETNYKTAQLAVTSSKAAVLKAKTNLGYATIYSTIDGVVISRAVEEGQTVAASFSTPTLFTIANDLTKMRVIANVDEADIGQVKEGQRVTFSVDAFPNDTFDGQVVQVRLEATTTSNVVTYEVVIDAPNPDIKLKPGLTANVTIYTLEKKDVLLIPTKALKYTPDAEIKKQIKDLVIQPATFQATDNQSVVWVKSGNTLTPKLVTIGIADYINTEIIDGLSAGDVVAMGTAEAKNVEQAATGETSPFMPQRPGRNNKK